jgi:hypothetical protein
MLTANVPLRNDLVASQILAVIAITDPSKLRSAIEAQLDLNYRSRSARSAARDGSGSARTGDRETSVLAAAKVKVSKQKRAILRVLASTDVALCAAQISNYSGVILGSASTRMKELVTNLGFVRESGKVLHAGSYKLTYVITPAGRRWAMDNHVA